MTKKVLAKEKEKHLVVTEETHAEVRRLAKDNGVTTDKQIRMMLAATRTDKKD